MGKKKLLLGACLLMCFLIGCGDKDEHKHTWIPQTCTEPLICTTCGATKGEPDGHRMLPPTCAEPSTCAKCGYQEGETIAHTWSPATSQQKETCIVCGATQGEYVFVAPKKVFTGEGLIPVSNECILFAKDDLYGVLNSDGKVIIEPEYDDYVLYLYDNSFVLNKGRVSDLYDASGKLIWSNDDEFADYEIVGFSDGILLLKDRKMNYWYYLDASKDFEKAAFVAADVYGKSEMVTANTGFATGVSKGDLGYLCLSLSDNSFKTGDLGDGVYVEPRGCAVNDNGNLLVSKWQLQKDRTYEFAGCGFYNVLTDKYVDIKGFTDEECAVRHIYCYNGKGINEYDCIGDYMLIKNNGEYNLYDYVEDKFLTDYGLEAVFMGPVANIGVIKQKEELKYSFLDGTCNLTGDLYDGLTYFADGFALGLKDGNAFFINAKLDRVSEVIKATGVSHRFKDYYIIENDGECAVYKLN